MERRRGELEGRGQATRDGTRMGDFVTQSRFLNISPHPPCLSLQVTLSYGVFENKLNVIKLSGPFSPQEDPSRYGV